METITLKINEKTKAGKTLHTLLELLSGQPGIERVEEEKSPYNPEFVAMVKASAASKKRYVVENVEELWKSL